MNFVDGFSWARFCAMVIKEFIQMRRDRLTFAMTIGIPLIQLVLFGYAINSDPKHLPTAVFSADQGPLVRSLVYAMKNSEYFDIRVETDSAETARDVLYSGKAQFVLSIPENFSRDVLRGNRPRILMEADATDPAATSNALAALRVIVSSALKRDLQGVAEDAPAADPVELRVHALFNPEAVTQYNIVPGLMGVVLTMTMVVITGVAISRERERGTMENLLSMPTRPLEVMLGKIIPYILVGYVQVGLILLAAKLLFDVPMAGSLVLLLMVSLIFIAANLSVGITFSTLAHNQLQAVQMAFFFFLPSILLSGFMFPFRGMPQWAQFLGEILPLTHFLRIVRGILLKGNGLSAVLPQVWPLLIFSCVVLTLAFLRYRRTLD